MKTIVLSLLVILVFGAINTVKGQNWKVDSVFYYHFSMIDSAYDISNRLSIELSSDKGNIDSLNIDRLPNYMESVRFLEKVTEIGSSNQDYFNSIYLDNEVIRKWKNWYANNSEKLYWEIKNARVNRKDKDIYTGKLQPKGL